MKVELLENQIKPYAWGSRTFIADLQRRLSPAATPEAELWMGAHPSAPSHLGPPERRVSLAEAIELEPEAALGRDVSARFHNELPFLMKVLAADQPLSLQAHPTRARARERFQAEEALGLASDDPERNYKDPRHKPELIVALTPFFALSGFRNVRQTRRLFSSLAVPELEPYLGPLEQGDPAVGLRGSLELLLGANADVRARLVESVVLAARTQARRAAEFAPALAWVDRLAALYPGDVGVVIGLFLNFIALAPGEAMFLPAGNLHAYLEGAGIEIMASSDNVLRGGLTPKRVDVPELMAVLEFSELEFRALVPEKISACEFVYRTPAQEFELSRIDSSESVSFADRRGPEIVLAEKGDFQLEATTARLRLAQGDAAFVPASEPEYTIRGSGTLFRARVPV